MTTKTKYVQVWVCPRNPDHRPYKAPVPVLSAVCGECASQTKHIGGKLPPASAIEMVLANSSEG